MELSVIIPTWRGMPHLPACIAALLPQLPPQAEVLVVDNASDDGTAGYVAALPAPVRHLRMPRNLGFAGGVNAGLRAARGELLFLLNDDAFVEPGCVPALLGTLADWPELGAVAGVLTFAHRPALVASAGIAIRANGAAVDVWIGRPVASLPAQPREVFGASGGLALLRRTMLDDVGVLDEQYGSYLEDADLAWRARLRGWRTAVVPAARARHVYSASAGQATPFKERLLARNRIRLIVRCWPDALLRRHMPAIIAYDLQALTYALAARRPAIALGRLAALRELAGLRAQRQVLQRSRRAPDSALAGWVQPAPWPWHELAERRRLEQILIARLPG